MSEKSTDENPSVFTPGHGPLSVPDERAATLGAAWLALAVFGLAYFALEDLIHYDR